MDQIDHSQLMLIWIEQNIGLAYISFELDHISNERPINSERQQ